jgi:hypothetical protein
MYLSNTPFARIAHVVSLVGCLLAVGCAADVGTGANGDAEPLVKLETEALSATCTPTPAALAVPDGNRMAFRLNAMGVQIYTCNATATGGFAWTFVAPEADLTTRIGGIEVGLHYAGPTWELYDGSSVVGAKVAAATVATTAVPWLLLSAKSHAGQGFMTPVTYIRRVNTVGGLAPATGCDAAGVGAEARVNYTATYEYFMAGNGGSPKSCY